LTSVGEKKYRVVGSGTVKSPLVENRSWRHQRAQLTQEFNYKIITGTTLKGIQKYVYFYYGRSEQKQQ
jgi:hypothetical protein